MRQLGEDRHSGGGGHYVVKVREYFITYPHVRAHDHKFGLINS